MTTEKCLTNQIVKSPLLIVGGFVLLLGGCAEVPDHTDAPLNPKTSGMAYIADRMHAQGDDDGAMEFYARAIQNAPKDAATRAKLADLLEARGMFKDAAEQYRELVKLEPDNADYWRGYGRVLVKENRPAEAKEKYQSALAIHSSDVKTLNGLGVSEDLCGDHVAAQEHYKKALDEKPDDLTTINNLGHSYVLSGKYDEAIKLLAPQAGNDQAPSLLRLNLAEAYARSGRDAEAEKLLKAEMNPAQIKKKMAQFRASPAKAAPHGVAVMLGSFTSTRYAEERVEDIKKQFPAETRPLTMDVVTENDPEEGKPVFFTRASGFKNAGQARAFCETLKKGGAFCKLRED